MQVYHKTINHSILKEIEIFVHKESELRWRVALSAGYDQGHDGVTVMEAIGQILIQKSFFSIYFAF